MYRKYLVIGSGPAGLHLTKQLIKHAPAKCVVDLVESSYLPGGLLRYGVAPDHPEVKSALNLYDELFANSSVNFYNNTHLTSSLFLDQNFTKEYDRIIFANGVEKARSAIYSGEANISDFVADANDIVNFYNANPAKEQWLSDKQLGNLSKAKRIVIFGNGNVSMDLARILTSKASEMAKYAFDPRFIEVLRNINLSTVDIVARRGVVESAFDLKELRELSDANNMKIVISREEYDKSANEASLKLVNVKADIRNRANARKFKYCQNLVTDGLPEHGRIALRYYLEPHSIVQKDTGKVVRCKRKQIDSSQADDYEDIPFDFMIKSFGYMNTPSSLYNEIQSRISEDAKSLLANVGWSCSNGKGKLADSYYSCDMIIGDILAHFNDSKVGKYQTKGILESIDNKMKRRNENYLKFRDIERKSGKELKDISIIKDIMLH